MGVNHIVLSHEQNQHIIILYPAVTFQLCIQALFAREHVAIWPSSRQRIAGRLTLVKQDGVVFLSWQPNCSSNLRGRKKGLDSVTYCPYFLGIIPLYLCCHVALLIFSHIYIVKIRLP